MIELEHVSHRYRHRHSLVDISCEFGSGLWGLLGPNGAGKSTLLSILATLREPDSGHFRLNGVDVSDDVDTIRGLVGFLPQRFSLPSHFRIRRVVEYAAWARGVEPGECRARARAALDRVGLLDRVDERVQSLSGGVRQRLGIACAIVGDPAVLLLDEPTVGLDPASRIGVRSLFGELAEDRTVIVSTHLLEDLQGFVSQLVVLSEGKLIFEGSYSELESVGRGHPVRNTNDAEAGYLTSRGCSVMPTSLQGIHPLRGLHRMAFPFTSLNMVLVTVSGAMCSFIALRDRWAWGAWQVQDVVVTLRESSTLWAIVAGLMGAGLAARTAPSDMVVGAAPARSILGIHWHWFWRQTAALLIGTVIVAAPLVVKTWLNATPTVAEASDLIVVLLSFAALVAVAHLLAAMVSHPIVWLVAPVVCIVLVEMPIVVNGNLLAKGHGSVAFAWSLGMSEPSGTHTVTVAAVVMRAIFFCVVTLSCLLTASRWSKVRADRFCWRRVAPCAALIAPPLIIAVVGVVLPVPLFRDAPLAFECSSHEGVRVCVTPPHRSLASSYAKPAQRVLSVLPRTVVSRDVLLAESGYQAHPGQLVIDLGRPTSYGPQQLSDLTGEGLAQSFSGRDACTFMSQTGGGELTSQQTEALNGVNSVERTILRLAGFQHDDVTSSERNSLDGMDITAFRHWYAKHYRAVSTCSLTPSDLHR